MFDVLLGCRLKTGAPTFTCCNSATCRRRLYPSVFTTLSLIVVYLFTYLLIIVVVCQAAGTTAYQ